MTIKEIQQEILRMKKEQDVCILAHAYQGQEILEVADYMGDSYGLSVQAAKSDCSGVIMCGVRFMAETCKVLSPDKSLILPRYVNRVGLFSCVVFFNYVCIGGVRKVVTIHVG